jgi:hypothetical protein
MLEKPSKRGGDFVEYWKSPMKLRFWFFKEEGGIIGEVGVVSTEEEVEVIWGWEGALEGFLAEGDIGIWGDEGVAEFLLSGAW